MFERLLEIVRALAQLAEQPRVFDRDDRLRREILQQRYLLLRERPHLLAINREDAQELLVLAQRNGKQGADAAQLYHGVGEGQSGAVAFMDRDIRQVDDSLAAQPRL